MKIHTCALMPFTADEMFFTRDSGLLCRSLQVLCRSLQALGVESNVIMLADPCYGNADPEDILARLNHTATTSRAIWIAAH
jgi:hypothetical protein